MRVLACVLVAAGALTMGAAGSASAGCYRDCDDTVVRPHHRSYHKADRSYDCQSYRGHGHRHHGYSHRHCDLPPLIFGGPESYMGPVYSTTGHYHYGPYVSHRANFGTGGCRMAYLPYGPTWQLASNC
jgi:hypothetical protein